MSIIVKYQKVSEILNKHDPMGLIKIGAPDDEYESEAIEIVNRIESIRSKMFEKTAKLYIENLVMGVFILQFDYRMVNPNNFDSKPIAEDIAPWFTWGHAVKDHSQEDSE